ncbi:uncharacterized protein TM35_000621160 [Trypanosoma theileri]|uniref:Mucin-associated surface protein (MASP) n=1 Tax=Trypanosoma theileri TaxID=67003 RepID=A0A1X0NFY8_9TRYP|nr:uncharacterized protein TM35_000621160 [Trypanosoma theileri]ORC83642.1 hypothetical protein TM35_000621160 [Trypanosoma theileri]
MRRMLCLLVLMLYCVYGGVMANHLQRKPPLFTEDQAAGYGIGRVYGVHPSSGPITGVPPVGSTGAIPGVPGAIPAVRPGIVGAGAPGVKVPGSLPSGTGAPPGVSAVDQGYKPGKPSGESPAKNHQQHPGVGVPGKVNVTLATQLGISPGTGLSDPTAEKVGVSGFKNDVTPDPGTALNKCLKTSNKSGTVIGGVPGADGVPCVPGVPGNASGKSVALGAGKITGAPTPDPAGGVDAHPTPGVDPKLVKSVNLTAQSQPDGGVGGRPNVNGKPGVGADLKHGVGLNSSHRDTAPEVPFNPPPATSAGNSSEYPGVPEAAINIGNGSSEAGRVRFSRPVTHATDAHSQSNTDSSDTASTQSEANGHQAENTATPAQIESPKNTPTTPTKVTSPAIPTILQPPMPAKSETKPPKKRKADSSSVSPVWVRVPLMILAVLFSATVY